jgi:molybdopterin synthase sulfur carrier subunit
MPTVRIPSPLRKLTDGQAEVAVTARDVRTALKALERQHPGIGDRLLDGDGNLRRFVNVFVRDEDVRFQDGLDTSVADDDTISVVPAVAGG